MLIFIYIQQLLLIPLPRGPINSQLITNPPVCQYGCTGACYTYNPGAYIPNIPVGADDSISYSMGSSLTLNGIAPGSYNPRALPLTL